MRRRTKKTGFDSKIVIDVGMAGLATRIIPMLVNNFFPLDPTLYSVVGAGGSYLLGNAMKKPILANAGISLGLIELVAPMIEDLIGGIGGGAPPQAPTLPGAPTPAIKKAVKMADYGVLQEYTNNPAMQNNLMYRDSY